MPNDPYTGRVLTSRIRSPHTVDVFKRAVAQLESINLSRIKDLYFSKEGPRISDISPLVDLDTAAPGLSPERPLLIMLSRVTNGVAEPVVALGDTTKVAYTEKPEGWVVKYVCLPNPNENYGKRPFPHTVSMY